MLPERLREVQRKLLCFDQYETDSDWLNAVARSLRPIAMTDQVYYVGPSIETDSRDPSFIVTGIGVDAQFQSRIRADFKGYNSNGDSKFAEDYSTFLHRIIRQNGPCAVHDGTLFDERQRKNMVLHSEAFEPARILRQIGLSSPRERGESLMIFGYSRQAQPSQDSATFIDLQRLAPVWQRALLLRQGFESQAHWNDRIDVLPGPIVVVGIGKQYFTNRAFELLQLSEKTRRHIIKICHALGKQLLRSLTLDELTARQGFEMPIDCPEGRFRLLARIDMNADSPVVLVSVEPKSSTPPIKFLQQRYALSPREIQVLRLLIGQYSDKAIAEQLGVSFHTARQYVAAVLRKADTPRNSLRERLWGEFLST